MIIFVLTSIFNLSIQITFIYLQPKFKDMSIDIDTLLKEKKLSKTDVAKKMGLSRESLYRILSGNPTLDNINKLADAIGVSISELFASCDKKENTIVCPNCGTKLELIQKDDQK